MARTPALKTMAAAKRPAVNTVELRKQLAAAKARIAELEAAHRELSRRIAVAVGAVQKLLDR